MKMCLSILLVFCIFAPSSFTQDTPVTPAASAPGAKDKPRIFVTDEPLHEGNAVARGNASASHESSGANPRVIEIQADLVKVCPHVTVTNRRDTADFTLLFRRESGKRTAMFAFGGLSGLALSAASKVNGASLFAANGDLVTATKQRTVEGAIRELCASIPAAVIHVAQQPDPAPTPEPAAQQPAAAQQPEQALAPIAPPPPPADTPPAPPKTISIGQTKDEVVAMFGQPQKVVKLPTKEMLYYPDMKVTLVKAKVSNVE